MSTCCEFCGYEVQDPVNDLTLICGDDENQDEAVAVCEECLGNESREAHKHGLPLYKLDPDKDPEYIGGELPGDSNLSLRRKFAHGGLKRRVRESVMHAREASENAAASHAEQIIAILKRERGREDRRASYFEGKEFPYQGNVIEWGSGKPIESALSYYKGVLIVIDVKADPLLGLGIFCLVKDFEHLDPVVVTDADYASYLKANNIDVNDEAAWSSGELDGWFTPRQWLALWEGDFPHYGFDDDRPDNDALLHRRVTFLSRRKGA